MPVYPDPDLFPDPDLYPEPGYERVAERALAHVAHLEDDQDSNDLLHALVAGMVNGIELPGEIAYGTDTVPGERALTDPAVCPFWALPHAALWVGGTVPSRPPLLTDPVEWEAYARQAVIEPFGALRGSPRALATLAAAYMDPDAENVRIFEHYAGKPFLTMVIADPADVPDPDLLLEVLNGDDVIVAGGRVDLSLVSGATWDDLLAAGTLWTDLSAVTWQAILDGTFVP